MRQPLTIEQALAKRFLSSRGCACLSPCGTKLAYTVEEPGRPAPGVRLAEEFCGNTAWVSEVGGATRRLGPEDGWSWSPVWSPDGTRIVYYRHSDDMTRVELHDLSTRETRILCERAPRVNFGFDRVRWLPDGKRLLLPFAVDSVAVEEPALEPGPTPEDRCTAVFVGSTLDSVGEAPVDTKWTDRYLSDLVLLDVDDGEYTTVVEGVRCMWVDLSPDGTRAAFTEYTPAKMQGEECQTRLAVVSVPDGELLFEANDLTFFFAVTVSWSPDGRLLAHSGGGQMRVSEIATGKTWIVDTGGAQVGAIYDPPLWLSDSETTLFLRDGELWTADAPDWKGRRVELAPESAVQGICSTNRSTAWTPIDGRSVLVAVTDQATGQGTMAFVDIDTGSFASMPGTQAAGFGCALRMDVAPATGVCLYPVEDVARPADLWVAHGSFDCPQQVTHLNSELEQVEMGRSVMVDWISSRGEPLKGELLLPAGYEEGNAYPLIVGVYPNLPAANRFHRYAILGRVQVDFTDMQLLATRGYAVFVPEIHASLENTRSGNAESVLPALDMLVERGIADPERIGLIGQSAGGFAVISLLTASTRFAVAVASASLSDWVAFAGQGRGEGNRFAMDYAKAQLGASIWEDRDRYIENSPFYLLDRVETPLLLLHGGKDGATGPHLAEQTFIGLKFLGKPVEYVRYEGENHHHGGWSYANRVDYTQRVLDWFERFLKG